MSTSWAVAESPNGTGLTDRRNSSAVHTGRAVGIGDAGVACGITARTPAAPWRSAEDCPRRSATASRWDHMPGRENRAARAPESNRSSATDRREPRQERIGTVSGASRKASPPTSGRPPPPLEGDGPRESIAVAWVGSGGSGHGRPPAGRRNAGPGVTALRGPSPARQARGWPGSSPGRRTAVRTMRRTRPQQHDAWAAGRVERTPTAPLRTLDN